MDDWRIWLKGLIAAVVGAVATIVTDPANTDFSSMMWRRALIGAVIALSGYLAKSPLPEPKAKK